MEKSNLRRSDWGRVVFLIVLSFFYLSPGGLPLLKGRTDLVLSDGSDPATLPYSYSILIDHLKNSPRNLFYGAVPTDRLNPPEGFSIWFPWIEKLSVSLSEPFVALEQQSTFFVFVLFALSGISFYLMSRVRGWGQSLSLALSICWAFSAYTRARAKVHMALVGVYFLPLVILGLDLAVLRRSRRSLLAAALCLLLAAMSAHYYLIILAFLTPFFIGYAALRTNVRSEFKVVLPRVILAAAPAVFLVVWSYVKPIPASWIKPDTITHIKTGETQDGRSHPFLKRFASRPVDFFTGDLAIGPNDLNPLRGWLTSVVNANLGDGNQHERSNGIRWLIWLAFGAAIWALTQERLKSLWTDLERRQIWLFLIFTAFCFWLSLEPDVLPIPGPSAWLAGLVSQFRVPSRAGVFMNFGILLVAGYFLHAWLEQPILKKGKKPTSDHQLWPRLRSKLALAGVLPLLAVAELPPFLNDMPLSRIVPQRADLADGQDCGYGLYYPYVSGTWGLLEYYYFLQSMRESRCKIINANSDTVSDRNRQLMRAMPLHEKYLELIRSNPAAAKLQLTHMARCLPMDWIVFDPRVSKSFMNEVCGELGFEITSGDTCRSKERARTPMAKPESCIR